MWFDFDLEITFYNSLPIQDSLTYYPVWLHIAVLQAKWLAAADMGGTSDPYCLLQLINCRRQTHTEYKTLCPQWHRTFTLYVITKDTSIFCHSHCISIHGHGNYFLLSFLRSSLPFLSSSLISSFPPLPIPSLRSRPHTPLPSLSSPFLSYILSPLLFSPWNPAFSLKSS